MVDNGFRKPEKDTFDNAESSQNDTVIVLRADYTVCQHILLRKWL